MNISIIPLFYKSATTATEIFRFSKFWYFKISEIQNSCARFLKASLNYLHSYFSDFWKSEFWKYQLWWTELWNSWILKIWILKTRILQPEFCKHEFWKAVFWTFELWPQPFNIQCSYWRPIDKMDHWVLSSASSLDGSR